MTKDSERRVRRLKRLARDLARSCGELRFAPPVTHVSNPLVHARLPHDRYLELHGGQAGRILLLGMNPGPWGMAQTGVPFGDPTLVREFVGVEGRVDPPADAHPKRPVLGFDSPRTEVSGQRVWGWARDRFGTARAFFERFFVVNYCPVAFMEESGRNRTPDKLPAAEREALFETCDRALVMYCGRIVEESPVPELFARPAHPYTAGLLAAVPRISTAGVHRVHAIPGNVPQPGQLPAGCHFADRCSQADSQCRDQTPETRVAETSPTGDARLFACHHPLHHSPRDYAGE